MFWSVKIGSIAGTAVRIHITFILFLAWIFGASYVSGGPHAAWSSLLFMALLFLCVLAHEFGHILTARAFGVLTHDVILLPIGGVARLERIPEKPLEEFLIAIAGPLVNVVIAFGLILVTSATLDGGSLATVESAKISMVDRLASVNLFLALFNLIPAFPMDGGRILRAFLSARLGFVRATEIAATIGQWVAFALGFIGLFGSPMLIFIAIFVYLAASSEAHMVALRSSSQGVPVGAATMTQFATLTPESRIDLALASGTGCMRGVGFDISATRAAWPEGGGEMGARVRAKDWSESPLGPPDTWPQSVRAAVSICLNSRFPILLWIGPDLRLIYNDSYIPFLGEIKHPGALGEPGCEVWSEIWPAIGPMHAEVASGRSTSVEDFQMFFARHLPREEVYVTFSYSPIFSADGSTVDGVFCACIEATEKVVGARRLVTLRNLGARSTEQQTAEIACRDAAEVLRRNPLDFPFAAIYLLENDGTSARLAAGIRIDDSCTAFPARHPLSVEVPDGPWPLSGVVETGQSCEISDLAAAVGIFRTTAWPDEVSTAFVLPILARTQQQRPTGLLIAGVSPRRVLDNSYRSFLELVAGHIATSIADARAFEAERRRAEALAEIDRAKTAFFSNVSHEFRTPLTLLRGPIEQVLTEPNSALAPDHRTLLNVAHHNSLRLLRLVNTLLDFSRVEAGRIRASYEPVDLSALTAELASNFRSACERAGLRLEVDCPPLGQPVCLDREMWEKIVLNLVSNAFKFTLEGYISVKVRPEGANATLLVKDTGVGIPEPELPNIFARFHRVEGQRGRTHEGSGIGLALVQELVRLHRGAIQVESKVGQGTTFTVSLPFGFDHLPSDHIQPSSPLPSTAIGVNAFIDEAMRWLPSSQASNISEMIADDAPFRANEVPNAGPRSRVLVVDDNGDMREYMRRLLASNYEVEAVADGEAAFASIDRQLPDLVLTDIMMPRFSGSELLARLRSDPSTRTLPIILVSARAGEEAKAEGLGAGADDYLLKPFAARELLAKVAASITAAGLRRETERLLRRNQGWLAGQKGAFQAAVNGAPLEEALGILVRTATDQVAGNARCAFYMANREGTELRHVVGMPESYARDVEGFRIGLDSLACGLAVATGEPVFTHDVIEEPRWAAWVWLAEKYDFRGCWSFPVETSAGTRVGSFAMYFREPRSPTLEDRELVAALTHTASIIMSRNQEVEERAQAGLALRESEARLQAAVELVNLGRYAWNPQTNELQWDDAVRAMWGLSGGAPVGYATWRSGVHPDDLPRVEAAIARCVDPSSDGLYDVEYRVNGRDGVERWIATRGRANFENGMAISFYGVALDITAQKQIERTLERRVETRTRDLEKANSDLRAQIERREAAEAEVEQLQRLDAIGQITSGVAHDFNNLLTVVDTNARLLSRNDSAPVDREGLELIRDAVQRGIDLTARLLAFSRKQRLEPQEVDLNSKITEMDRLLSATLGGTIRLRTTLDPNLWPALVDPSHLESIVMNLVINARDAMLSGGHLAIETFNAVIEKEPSAPHEPVRGQYAGLSVIDTGTGIPDDVLPRIFEPFFTTKKPGKGSGLGLAQVFGFAKQSGGGVSIETRVGQGTAVRVYLPLAEPASSTDLPDECNAKSARGPGIGARVLVVDDDTAVLRTTVRLLDNLDFETLAASSGTEALRLLGTGVKIDVVLTDLAMPEMSGVELTRIIRVDNPALPVILVTGYRSPEILSEFGDDQILQKPFADEQLFKKITSVLT